MTHEAATPFICKEIFGMFCEKEIGFGIARTVFTSPILPDRVIKVEKYVQSFQNVSEWQVWETVKDTPFAKWFAPCYHISNCGAVLIQARTTPALDRSIYPEKLPAFLSDTKYQNYGMFDGRLVCHDYGMLSVAISNGLTKRERKVDWWDAEE